MDVRFGPERRLSAEELMLLFFFVFVFVFFLLFCFELMLLNCGVGEDS